jgi:chromate transporter
VIYLQLYWEFFQIGLFSVGGGLATLPFISAMAQRTGWITQQRIVDMLAVAESTPGAIGVNLATYTGWTLANFFGGVVATLGLITPSIIIIILIARILQTFESHPTVRYTFQALRPGAFGLITVAAVGIMVAVLFPWGSDQIANGFGIDLPRMTLFLIVFFMMLRLKTWHPVWFILFSGLVGYLVF